MVEVANTLFEAIDAFEEIVIVWANVVPIVI